MGSPDPPESKRRRRVALIAGPLAAALVGLASVGLAGLSSGAASTAAITTWCALWWVLEPIPLAATSLIPFALLPLAGVISHREVATAYGHHLVLLMLAGSIVSTAMERSEAHRRLALGMIRAVGGGGGRRLVLGFLLASAALSMWMSNTATTLMLLPVALAVLASARGEQARAVLTLPLLLSVAYGGAIGGSATLIGTPPNLILQEQLRLSTGEELSFTGWMAYATPVAAVMIPIAWLWLTRRFRGQMDEVELPQLGPWRVEERRVLLVFGLMALAWMTRSGPFGGWGGLLGVEAYAGDSTVALVAALVLFVLPRGGGGGERLLDWDTAKTIPWGVFIMIGGGMAIGKAFVASELSAELGAGLRSLGELTPFVVVPLVCLVATFTTELTSNTATASVMMPILGAAAGASGIDPLWLMLPAGLGLNHAFMLPVASASNAITYGTGKMTTRQMAREGLVLNLLGTAVISAVCLAAAWSAGALGR
jgi:sodium-dependent dicarboxylate transporter 2/3/5